MIDQNFNLYSDPVLVFKEIKLYDGTDPDLDNYNFIFAISKDDPSNTKLVSYDYSIVPSQFTVNNSSKRIDVQVDLDDLGTLERAFYFATLYLVHNSTGFVTSISIRLKCKSGVNYLDSGSSGS